MTDDLKNDEYANGYSDGFDDGVDSMVSALIEYNRLHYFDELDIDTLKLIAEQQKSK